MNLGALIADDVSLVMDQLETITITLNRSNQGGTGITEVVTVENVNRSAMRWKLTAYQNVQLTDDDVPFYFGANKFVPVNNPAQILQGDVVTDSAGNAYKVQTSSLTVLETVWSLMTRRKNPDK